MLQEQARIPTINSKNRDVSRLEPKRQNPNNLIHANIENNALSPFPIPAYVRRLATLDKLPNINK